ncbi:DUF1449 family protein [Candidatus Poribacteria bacterium]|nr:DUF1449 family protein [Candidatus Poribacteria bacterium]
MKRDAMIEFLNYLIVSYNVWFTAPLAIVFLLALFRLATGAMDFGDVDTDVDMDADMDADMDIDADADVEADMDTHTGTQSPSFGDMFGFLNVGRVPLMIVLMSLFVTWGISGLIANALLNIPENPHWVWISCIIALFCCFLGTRYISIALSKLLPESEKAITDVQLLGLSGRVISGQITTTFGTARVRVPDGPQLTVSCRAKPDEDTPVKGDTVILINYDRTKRIFDVQKSEFVTDN